MAPPRPQSRAGAAPGENPRVLLRRLREIMAEAAPAQKRLNDLVSAIASNMVSEVCSIYLRRAGDQLELFATEGLKREAVHATRMKWGEGLVGEIARTGQPLSLAEAPKNPLFSYRPETGEDPFQSFLGVPILRGGLTIGVLTVQNVSVRIYTEEEIEALQTVAMVLAEVAASGELVDISEFEAVGLVLQQPDYIHATGIVNGVAMGLAAFHEPPLRSYSMIADDVSTEEERLETAVASLRRSVDKMLATMDPRLTGVPRDVLETYRMFAHDQGWLERMRDAVLSGLTAEAAVERVKQENHLRISRSEDPYMRERLHDLDDLAHRLLRHLAEEDTDTVRDLPDNAILFARTLGPAELLEYDQSNLRGVVLGEGSAASHVAIVARALEIPLIGRASDALESVYPEDYVIIDGATGDVHIRPQEDVVSAYEEKLEIRRQRQAQYDALRDQPAVTLDGVPMCLMMNAGLRVDLPHLEEAGAEGIGLFRTELQFMVSTALPKLKAQTELYADVLEYCGDRPVIFRTVDLGGDKVLPYMAHEREENPALGWRAIRLSLDRPGLLRYQLRALLKAGTGRKLNILFPMITVVEELRAARRLLHTEYGRMQRLGEPLPAEICVGAMIEVPAIAWSLDRLLPLVDFVSIGGNDLMQFFFAADRGSARVSGRYDLFSPAFLSFIKHLVDRANAADKPISYCGEQAAAPLNAMALLGVGLTRLSLPGTAVGPVKQMINTLDLQKLRARMDELLTAPQDSIRTELSEFARETGVAAATM